MRGVEIIYNVVGWSENQQRFDREEEKSDEHVELFRNEMAGQAIRKLEVHDSVGSKNGH